MVEWAACPSCTISIRVHDIVSNLMVPEIRDFNVILYMVIIGGLVGFILCHGGLLWKESNLPDSRIGTF